MSAASSDLPTVLLPIVRWKAPREPISLEFDSGSIPDLVAADLVGPVTLKGYADVNDHETIVHLTVECHTKEICGRSLEEFQADLSFPLQILLRRDNSKKTPDWDDDGDETYEVTVHEDLRELDITEVLRQAIELERPLSPIKPGVDLPEGVLPDDVPIEEPVEETTDPRWDALRKLKGL